MNILYLTNHLETGGITSYIFSLAAGLRQKGHQVYIASDSAKADFPIPIRTKAEFSLNVVLSFLKLLPFVKEKKIEIIHANTRVTQVLASLLSRFSGKPYISTCHGFFKPRFFRKAFPCWGEKVIAISNEVRAHLIEDFGLNPENIRMVNNGVDLEKFKTRGASNRRGPVAGIVARLSDVKGHVYLIRAMKKVLADIPDAKLIIAGEGKMKDELVSLGRKLGIEDKITFFPNTADTGEVLALLDVFVLPSLEEGLGLSLMEAMAFGLAVIGSDAGGIKTLIKNDYNGLLFTPRDTDALAAAITRLFNDPEKRKIFGANARNFIRENFSLEKMLIETEGVYRQCLRKN